MMVERAYTVKEIDELRNLCMQKIEWGSFRSNLRPGQQRMRMVQGNEHQRAEDLVRTYMMAGLTSGDLLASEDEL